MEELLPNEFFFDKKRKAMVKREFYQEEGSTTKKFKVLTDGKDKKKEEFSVGVLKNQLKWKNRLIKTLEARLDIAEEVAKDQASVNRWK